MSINERLAIIQQTRSLMNEIDSFEAEFRRMRSERDAALAKAAAVEDEREPWEELDRVKRERDTIRETERATEAQRARWMRQATELLTACEALLSHWGACQHARNDGCDFCAVRATIAKARGA